MKPKNDQNEPGTAPVTFERQQRFIYNNHLPYVKQKLEVLYMERKNIGAAVLDLEMLMERYLENIDNHLFEIDKKMSKVLDTVLIMSEIMEQQKKTQDIRDIQR